MKKTFLLCLAILFSYVTFAQQLAEWQRETVHNLVSEYTQHLYLYALDEDIESRETVINLFENRNNMVYNDFVMGNTETEIFAYLNTISLQDGGYEMVFEDDIKTLKIDSYTTPLGENYAQVVLKKKIHGHGIHQTVKNIVIIDLLKSKIVNVINSTENIAENNLTLSQLVIKGKIAAKNRDYQNAVKWFTTAVAQGDGIGQTYLGYMYFQGLGVKQNYSKAAELFEEAAEQNGAIAQNYLGLMYEQGIGGVAKNYEQAAMWYLKAAEQDLNAAQFNIGYMYEKGLGVAKNYKEAKNWYLKAAAHNHIQAQLYLGSMYEHGLGVVKNNKEAIKWYQKAALQDNQNAMNALKRLKSPKHNKR